MKKLLTLPIVMVIGVVVIATLFILPKFIDNNNSTELTIDEIDEISKSIAAVSCPDVNSPEVPHLFGSGSYLRLHDGQGSDYALPVLVTNAHVAQNSIFSSTNPKNAKGQCYVSFNHMFDDGFTLDDEGFTFTVYDDTTTLTEFIDIALLISRFYELATAGSILQRENNNPYPFCENINSGKRVYIFGYPGAAETQYPPFEKVFDNTAAYEEHLELINEFNKKRNLIVTEGIISGESEYGYFTSAKLDSGVSGGLVVAKENGTPCLVGIPTAASIGEFENLGVIQPISNIYDENINWHKLMKQWKDELEGLLN